MDVTGRALALALAFFAVPGLVSAQDAVDPATEGSIPPEESAAAARDAEGRGLFEAGRAAFTDGRYEDALDYFRRAYELSHRSALLYNIGSANDRLRRDAEALAAFEQYVRELPDAPNAREVEARIRLVQESVETATPAPDVTPTVSQAEIDQQAFEAHQAARTPPVEPVDQGPGVLGEWWLWTIIGAVVAGGVVTGVVLATQDQPISYPPYATGDNGVAMTLTLPWP